MPDLEYPPVSSVPVPFFVPGADDSALAEKAWQELRRMAGFASTERRVQRIQYDNPRGLFTSEVGYLESDDEFDWLTTAIFEPADEHSPWTISIMRIVDGHAQWRNPPILLAQSDVLETTEFLPLD